MLTVLLWQASGACLDFLAALRNPIELDYGEGIVWQQAALMFGPRMYPVDTGLPFVVFHYPPLFHTLARIVSPLMPDLLGAGRLVSIMSAFSITLLVAGLVWYAGSTDPAVDRRARAAIAVAAGLLALTVHATRAWGQLMRVDTLAVALSLAGVLVAIVANGRLFGTVIALLLCVASVYAKQTQLPAGVAVFLFTLARKPSHALIAGGVALVVGTGCVALLQVATQGGFLLNILGYNVNRFALKHVYWAFWPERTSVPIMALILVAFAWLAPDRLGAVMTGRGVAGQLAVLRAMGRAEAGQCLLLLYFALVTVMLLPAFKSGSTYNYFLEWLCLGSALAGVVLTRFYPDPGFFGLHALLIVIWAIAAPQRLLLDHPPPDAMARQDALVDRVRAAPKPIGSEQMTVLMQAGKPVIYEPAIVTELASKGQWDEGPLLAMIRSHGFSFMITTDDDHGGSNRRTPGVDAAMRSAYPHVERIGPKLWLHSP